MDLEDWEDRAADVLETIVRYMPATIVILTLVAACVAWSAR